MAEEYELGTVGPIPTVNPNVAKIGEMLKIAKKYADQYYVKENIPLIGGMTLGETLLGKAPEEVERWGQGDYPFRNPATVVGTGGNRLDIYKTGRFEPTFDVLANVALPIAGAAKYTKGLPVGGTIQDVSKVPLTAKEAEIIASKVDELGFHSPLENAILKIQQTKGTGDQFLKQLEKTPGVKTEELEVTGLKQYLLDRPTVTKQELLDQMATSRVKLEQKVLAKGTGEDSYSDYRLRGGEVFDDDEYIMSLADDLHYDMKSDDVIRAQEREALLKADPERYEGYPNAPYMGARLENDIDNVLFEQAKLQANEMYYDNPITHHYDDYGYDIYGNADNGYSIKDPQGNFLELGNRNGIYNIDEAEEALRQHHLDNGLIDIDGGGGAKYEDYTLPGKYENYREMLTTYEPKRSPPSYEIKELPEANKEAGKNFGVYEGDKLINTWHGSGNAEDWVKNHTQNYKEYGNFESSHFDEPNILAHTRLNDRIINGKKTLMVEEIQSDWHQAGRKKGYQTGNPKKELNDYEMNLPTRAREAMKENALKDGLTEQEADQFATKIVRNTDFDGMVKYLNENDKYKELFNKVIDQNKLVPDAPYKKNWHELMMKQILNEAVKGDYEAVAFTTGKQQAARYNLSKQINSIDWKPYNERGATKIINVMPINGNLIELPIDAEGKVIERLGGQFAGKSIDEIIGKEVAKKIMETPDGDLTGQGLEIGGEGMKKFYDDILPNFVNKYGKKYGIAVKKEYLTPPDNDRFMNFKDWAVQKDPGLNDTFLKHSWNNKDDLYKEFLNTDRRGDEVHYFDLSDMAKKDIKEKGQPLFSGIGLAPAPLLMDYEEDN